MKRIWKATAMTLALALSSSLFVACGEDDPGTISGNYETATAQETYAALSSINVDALTDETVENPRLAAAVKNDFSYSINVGEESFSTGLGLDLKLRSWEAEDEEMNAELAAKANLNFKASQIFAQELYSSYFSPNAPILDSNGDPIVTPAIDFSVDAEIYANNSNAFLKMGTDGFNVYEGTEGSSNQLISASLADKDFNWMYKFDMEELIGLLMSGDEETVTSSDPDSDSALSPEQTPSLIESFGLTEDLLATGAESFGLEYSMDVSKSATKIKIATTEATKTALNALLFASEEQDSSSVSTEFPTRLETFDIALYLQISDNGTPVKIAASVNVKLNISMYLGDDDTETPGSLTISDYLDVDFSWIKSSVLPEGITESTDYQAVTVEQFMTAIESDVGILA